MPERLELISELVPRAGVIAFLVKPFRRELGRLSLEHKLPAICQFREMVEAGCLAGYGVKRREMYAMLAAFADKRLKRARPGETVAQQPAEVELVIYRKTARQLGIDIPPAILGCDPRPRRRGSRVKRRERFRVDISGAEVMEHRA